MSAVMRKKRVIQAGKSYHLARGELVFSRGAAEGAENDFAYEYDDIGNRMTSLDLGMTIEG